MNNRIHLEDLDSVNKFIRTELFNNNNFLIWFAFIIQSYDEFNDEVFYKNMFMVSLNNFFTVVVVINLKKLSLFYFRNSSPNFLVRLHQLMVLTFYIGF